MVPYGNTVFPLMISVNININKHKTQTQTLHQQLLLK